MNKLHMKTNKSNFSMSNIVNDANNKNISRKAAILLLILTALLWSLGGVLIKFISWHPIAIAGLRSAVAALFILIIIKKPRITWSLPQIGGALAYAITVIGFVTATKLTTAANAILLQYSAPIYVALFAGLILKEKTRPIDWVTIFIVIGGMVLFFIEGISIDNIYGNLIAVFSGLTFAALTILMRMQKEGSPLETAFLGNILTAIFGMPYLFLPGKPDFTGWVALIVLGVFQLGLSYILYSIAIKNVTALEATIVPVIEPVLNPLWVYLFAGEIPGKWAIVGGIIVVVSVTLRCILIAAKSVKIPVAESS